MTTSELVGSSSTFQALLEQVEMVAPVDSAVLIQGETGTGKEVIARAIHDASPRSRNRFVALNCAAIPSALLESELFGFEKGAFTGAIAQTKGRFQAADRGTLFLDEIGDLPLELQPKLLRVLQERQVEPLGGGRPLQIDVRVIAATNQDLGRMVRERTFRADLYYRLNVFPMLLPPLRKRRDDIPLLVEYFVRKFAQQQHKAIAVVPDGVMDALQEYDWPGNIRELQNVIERGVIITTGSSLTWETVEHLTQGESTPSPHLLSEQKNVKTLADAERAHITSVLRETNGMVGGPRGAAVRLGLPRTTLIAKMQRLGISSETQRIQAVKPMRKLVQLMDRDSPHQFTGRYAADSKMLRAVV